MKFILILFLIFASSNSFAEIYPSADTVQHICGMLADEQTRTVITSNKVGIEDFNNDGINETSEICWGGTANPPCIRYKNMDGEEINIRTIGFEWKDYWTYGLDVFFYQGRTYRLNSYDDLGTEPAYLSYIDKMNNEYILCDFENASIEKIIEVNGNEPSTNHICFFVNTKKNTEFTYFTPIDKPIISHEDLKNSGRFETSAIRQGWLDYDNDGTNNLVVELEYASGRGRGCDYNYFDELTTGGSNFVDSENRNLLLKLQEVSLDPRYPSCGGMNNSLFEIRGKVYYEHRAGNEHYISYIYKGEIIPVCKFKTTKFTKVKKIKNLPNE